MFNSRRFARITVAAIIALVGFAPTSAMAAGGDSAPAVHGPAWCC